MIPKNYEEWRHCIIVECGLELTPEFIEKRIAALQDHNQHYTQQFIRSFGHEHLEKVLAWFKQAQS